MYFIYTRLLQLLDRKRNEWFYSQLKILNIRLAQLLHFNTTIVQYSPAVTLAPVTLFLQCDILNWVQKKFELSYFLTPSYTFCSFSPQLRYFFLFSLQLSYFFAHLTRYVSTIRPRSQWAQDPSQLKIPVSPGYCFK